MRNALVPGLIGSDLFAANQQRGRDRGIADYNQVRASIGLARVENFSDITSDTVLAGKLEALYPTVEDIDLLVGLFAENAVAESGAGETLQAILLEQYQRIRDGDRFWFERSTTDGGYLTSEEISRIQQVTFSDILKLNTEITDIPSNGLLVPSTDNPIVEDILDLTGTTFSGQANVSVTREAGLNNTVGFYVINDTSGTVVDPVTGQSFTPDQGTAYLQVAIAQSVADFSVDNLTTENFNVNFTSGSILAPYIIQNGTIEDFNNGTALAFTAFEAANSDGENHVISLGSSGDNIFQFAFEDWVGPANQGSDRDFNDLVVDITFV